jgi:tetratricopeptide (TPR) repeat protein
MKRFGVLSWLCVLIVTVFSPALAETRSLDGQIRDSRTHTKLPYVKVELLYRGIPLAVEFTDDDGRFFFSNVEPRYYTVSATLSGYDAVSFSVATDETRIDFELNRTAPPSQRIAPLVSLREYMVPENAKKEFARAQKELDRQDCVKAIPHLESGLRLYDQSPAALNDLGNCQRKLGDLPRAEAAFKRAMAFSTSAYIAMNLAETFTAQQKFSEAESMLQEVIAKTADNGGLYYALSVTYFKQDRFEEAEAAAVQADQRSHLPDLHLLLAKIYAKTEPDKVVTQLERYLKEAPNGTQSKAVREALRNL